jgi:hypothetical protein
MIALHQTSAFVEAVPHASALSPDLPSSAESAFGVSLRYPAEPTGDYICASAQRKPEQVVRCYRRDCHIPRHGVCVACLQQR